MHTIVIIGAGQLGSRHLQGLARVETPLSIHLLDPSSASLDRARERFLEVAGAQSRHTLTAVQQATDLPKDIDLAISATTADHRLSSLQPVLAHARVKHLVLEKVLFQKLAEYPAAAALLERSGAQVSVNCARRMFAGYQEVKAFFGDETPHLLQVTGANWGLGCNGIHFCDLFAFLTGDDTLAFDTTQLDAVVHPSKREGFYEFSGTLVGRQGDRRLELQARAEGTIRHLVLIRSATRTVLVDEVGGTARFLDEAGGGWVERPFAVPFQSQLTDIVTTDVLAGRPPQLPGFAASARLHEGFIGALLGHFNRVTSQQTDVCPIT